MGLIPTSYQYGKKRLHHIFIANFMKSIWREICELGYHKGAVIDVNPRGQFKTRLCERCHDTFNTHERFDEDEKKGNQSD